MWKSREEIVKVYNDHIESLRFSGLPFNMETIYDELDRELAAWDETHEF